MAEYIEREAAFNAVFGQFCASSDETEAALNAAIEEIRAIPAADVRPVVTCADCEHNNRCLTQEFAEDCGKIPLDRNTFFCADGERRSNA